MLMPFPGMDPYLETPALWPDVHMSLAGAVRRQIQQQLSPRYAAIVVPYTAFETIDISTTRAIVPDVGIVDRDTFTAGSPATIAPPPFTGIATMDVPTRYARIEIRTIAEEELVTAIEILSPVNKRPGYEGADAYERKRREIFRSSAHLLEIDLLRVGRRPALQTPVPASPYMVFLSRVEQRPRIAIWPIELREAIALLPVPLRAPDADVVLDLGQALRDVYDEARYERRIDYREPPPPPVFDADDLAWIDTHLRAQGMR